MDGGVRVGPFVLICLVAVVTGAGMGILLGGAGSDSFETVVKTVQGERHTVTKTETETVTRTTTETVTDSESVADPLADGAATDVDTTTDDDADHDNCSDSYAPVCLDPSTGTNDLSCSTIPQQDFTSTKDDPYGLDGDGNQVACESK